MRPKISSCRSLHDNRRRVKTGGKHQHYIREIYFFVQKTNKRFFILPDLPFGLAGLY